MSRHIKSLFRGISFVSILLLAGTMLLAAEESFSPPGTIDRLSPTDPTKICDGTRGPAAELAIKHGPLPASGAELAEKLKATKDAISARKNAPLRPYSSPSTGINGFAAKVGRNFPGLADPKSPTSDSTLAIGPSKFIQLVNRIAGVAHRNGSGGSADSLETLAKVASGVNVFDPQILWDATTQRYYYAMDAVCSASDNRIAYGFSKTSAPTNFSSDWCHYDTSSHYGTNFPDYPKIGDSQYYILIGVNVYTGSSDDDEGTVFQGSDHIAINKPPVGSISTCPPTPNVYYKAKVVGGVWSSGLVDSAGNPVFTPVPANQIDTNVTGYVIARNLDLPPPNGSNMLWFYRVKQVKTISGTAAHFGKARGVTTGNYIDPPNIEQPGSPYLLDSSDARMTQAVQAIDPRLGTFSFWTQHTIRKLTPAGDTVAAVRYYEIDPVGTTPTVKTFGDIFLNGTTDSFFNAAISSDRTADGRFGNSYLIQFNHVSTQFGINAGIEAVSSVDGAAITGPTGLIAPRVGVALGVAPYLDGDCVLSPPLSPAPCRWGDYAGLVPDPSPPLPRTTGVVWGTNQFSGNHPSTSTDGNWATRVFSLGP